MDTPARVAQSWLRHRHDLALGIERIGLVSLRFPAIVGVLAIVLAIAAGFGVARIKVDNSLSQLFRSDTPEFKLYQQESRLFPSSEFDVLVVVDGKTLLERPSIAKLRNLVIDLQLIDETRGIISLFSARQPPENGQLPAPLVPDNLPSGAAYQQLVQRISSNEIIRGKLLSTDGKLTLIVLGLNPDAIQSNRLSRIVEDIRQTADADLAGTGLKASLTGVPVMQLEIRNALERDRVIYNAVGFAAGCLIAILFFRRVSLMVIAAGPPLTAILLGLGALGWLDFRLNLFLNIMTPLIMVISFSDSMQLTFAARDRLIAGESRYQALGKTDPAINFRGPQTGSGRRGANFQTAPGIGDLTFHDLKGGTAVVRLAIAGATVPQLATFTGHNLKDVEAILDAHYLAETFSSLKPRC